MSKPKSATGLVYWICSLVNTRYQDGEDLHVHFGNMQDSIVNLCHAKLDIPEIVLTTFILNSMPESYDNVSNSLHKDELTIAEVKTRLLEVY